MNLLPKSCQEFGSVDYWEKFFQQRGRRAFEWYGSYLELCGVLHKYIKPREKPRRNGKRTGRSSGLLTLQRTSPQPQGSPLTSYLCCEHHKAMIAGLALLRNPELLLETPLALLVVGLGRGSLPLFVHDHFPKSCVDAVEIDPSMLEVATQWFGFSQSDRMKVHIADGLDYITSLAGREAWPYYSVVVFDVISKDPTLGMSCPPPAFVDQPFLQKVKSILTPEGACSCHLASSALNPFRVSGCPDLLGPWTC
ncbi:eEF1A lysine and N-terminal methyltransferase-like isoform X1 [Zalophus californianus]|uniref:EEF1A lysine and N-terminal methyltransferase-like isoform X1 n=1 Tax=Zalophus californianus TaxID=9704 RepID=A0A6P9FBR1_ZALCA|nr:eEF1A lysine and N-terminal methyltransferase-like isoform X1 [Zalophus californianus]